MIGPLTGLLVLLDAGGFAVLVMLSYVLLTVIRGGCGRGSRLAFAVAVHSYPASPPAPPGPRGSARSRSGVAWRFMLGDIIRFAMTLDKVELSI